MSTHPTECRCPLCIHELKHDSDRAQAQTLTLLDLLSLQRRELRQLQAAMTKTIDGMCDRLDFAIGTEQRKAPTRPRGFAALSAEERKEMATRGGKTAQARGLAHKFTAEELSRGGTKGGAHWRESPDHLAEIGKRGGSAKKGWRKKKTETQGAETPEPSDHGQP